MNDILKIEVFKTISHNPNYSVSNYGNVKNNVTGEMMKSLIHIRKGAKNPRTYLRIELKRPRKKYLVHRLVASAFLPNIYNFDQINHKDENGLNNHVDNLEWCNNTYNCTYSRGKPVYQYDREGNLLNGFDSISMAALETNSDVRLISSVCCGKRETHNNYKWKYATIQ